jgi:hypothetical protein
MAIEKARQLVAHLAEATGLASLALDDDNRCGLRFDEALDLEMEFPGDGRELRLSGVIGTYAPDLELPALRAIAGANLAWAGTGGGTLAADTDRRRVILQYRESIESLDNERLVRLVEGFLDTADLWRRKLSELIPEGVPPDAPAFGLRV